MLPLLYTSPDPQPPYIVLFVPFPNKTKCFVSQTRLLNESANPPEGPRRVGADRLHDELLAELHAAVRRDGGCALRHGGAVLRGGDAFVRAGGAE